MESRERIMPDGRVGVVRRALPSNMQWTGHCGVKARNRYLKQRWRRACNLKDEFSCLARDRLTRSCADDPYPDYQIMHLSNAALLAVEGLAKQGTTVTWAEAINSLLDKFEKEPGNAAVR